MFLIKELLKINNDIYLYLNLYLFYLLYNKYIFIYNIINNFYSF